MKKSGMKGRVIGVAAIGLMFVMTLSMLAPSVSASSAAWEYTFPMGAARTQALVAQDTNSVVYIAGGVPTIPFFTDGFTYAYNPGTGTWATLTGSPWWTRGCSGGFGEDGRLYLISGWRDTVSAPTPYNQIYNVTTNSWTMGTSIPTAVWEAKSFTNGTHFFVVGGESGAIGHENLTQIYNITTDSWWTGAVMPDGLTSGATVTVGGYGYYFGGENTSGIVADAYRYDIVGDSWTKIASLPAPVCAETAVVGADGLVYVFGGADSASNTPGTTYATGYAYDIATNSWTAIPDMNLARAWLGSAVHDNKVLAIGGNDATTVRITIESLDTLQSQVDRLQTQLNLLQTQLTNEVANLQDQVDDLSDQNALLKQQLVNLSANLNQTMADLDVANAALGTTNNNLNNAKSAADSANMIGMIGIIIGIVAIIIAVIALVMKRKAPIQQMQPQPPMPPQ